MKGIARDILKCEKGGEYEWNKSGEYERCYYRLIFTICYKYFNKIL